MPNHVTNKLTITGVPEDKASAILQSFIKKDDKGRPYVDFEAVVAPPDSPAYRDEPDQHTARQSPDWWHSWNCLHWGTKWNAFGTKDLTGDSVTFDTAWSPPSPVVEALSKKFPGAVFTLEYIDEGWCFAGHESWQNGGRMELTELKCNQLSPEFCRICAELKGYDPSEEEEEES